MFDWQRRAGSQDARSKRLRRQNVVHSYKQASLVAWIRLSLDSPGGIDTGMWIDRVRSWKRLSDAMDRKRFTATPSKNALGLGTNATGMLLGAIFFGVYMGSSYLTRKWVMQQSDVPVAPPRSFREMKSFSSSEEGTR